jgi:cell division protein FtsI/penicillin-binding protein 2
MAVVAFAAGAIVGAHSGGSPAESLAARYVNAWAHADYATMYSELDPATRGSLSAGGLANDYEEALTTATATSERAAGRASGLSGGRVSVPVEVSTRLFGSLSLAFELTIVETGGNSYVRWSPSLVFPGLAQGELLSRRTTLPQRAALLARDGSVLAEGPPGAAVANGAGEGSRTSPLGEAGAAVLGTVGPVGGREVGLRRHALEAEGVPADALVGVSGLELALDDRLRGTPGGELLAGTRVIASAAPRAAPPVRTSISPSLQRATAAALGGQYGGIVAMVPSSGQILAVAGIGLDGLQPPGSTFKMVTVTGALAANVAKPETVFPYATYATLDGVKLHNANGEECGGTLENAFAVSCNSVFSPLGVKLGAARLVQTAEAYGFNQPSGVAGAPASTLPPARQIQGELDIGSTAIGQGEVLATPLQMATVAATIGDGGRRPRPSFLADSSPAFVARASSSSVARTVRHLMIQVVRAGTGTAAAVPGVTVAGKTGTAELKSQCTTQQTGSEQSSSASSSKESCRGTETEASNTDAWFAAFAPALHPRVAVCVLLVKDGAGGATAAPVARAVIEAALQGY